MRLTAYLEANGLTHEQFAKLIGCGQPTVTRYVNGRQIPNRAAMRRIFDVTNGLVAPNDFFNISVVSAGHPSTVMPQRRASSAPPDFIGEHSGLHSSGKGDAQ